MKNLYNNKQSFTLGNVLMFFLLIGMITFAFMIGIWGREGALAREKAWIKRCVDSGKYDEFQCHAMYRAGYGDVQVIIQN